ncbi:hypothetical protein [Streptomyces justiciae]|uniref:Alkylmercury lyase n=1 Tax=Streptomyces justiciae TaxID=2780140 RepID=A0ABU3M6V0_9ACTN|nr:hypothetical protein [Streptomyces justiciae]MDT7847251.1 hypothetical protein [Streptomyces justiciae]
MSKDLRHVPHKLHSALEMASAILDLPLTAPQREALALELTGPVRALIAEALADIGDDTPVRYAVNDVELAPGSGEFEVSEFAGCIARVGLDVDLDSPAGTVAAKVRRQPDVTGIEIRDAHTFGVTVDPQSLDAWRWWLHQFQIDPATVVLDGTVATATGTKSGATVHLRGDGVPAMYSDQDAASLMCLVEARP